MYIKFRVEDRQCIWSFGSHWPMYIEFCWRPLSTLFHYVSCRKMAIALRSSEQNWMWGIWWQLNRQNNSTTAVQCHFFWSWEIFEPQLSSESQVEQSLDVYKFLVWSAQCPWSLWWYFALPNSSCTQCATSGSCFFSREGTHEVIFFMTAMQAWYLVDQDLGIRQTH
jgi:hypothetical protein